MKYTERLFFIGNINVLGHASHAIGFLSRNIQEINNNSVPFFIDDIGDLPEKYERVFLVECFVGNYQAYELQRVLDRRWTILLSEDMYAICPTSTHFLMNQRVRTRTIFLYLVIYTFVYILERFKSFPGWGLRIEKIKGCYWALRAIMLRKALTKTNRLFVFSPWILKKSEKFIESHEVRQIRIESSVLDDELLPFDDLDILEATRTGVTNKLLFLLFFPSQLCSEMRIRIRRLLYAYSLCSSRFNGFPLFYGMEVPSDGLDLDSERLRKMLVTEDGRITQLEMIPPRCRSSSFDLKNFNYELYSLFERGY